MKKDTTLLLLALGAVALLWHKAQSTSTPTTSAGNSGAGGPPAWASTSGPMGAKYNPMTGTVEMQPLKMIY